MATLNKIMVIGNLTRDPESKFTPKGTAIANFSIAVNRKFTSDGGETREEVIYLDVTAWGKLAETVGKYLTKGSPIFIEGRLQQDVWDDKTTGQKRSKIQVVAEQIQFLGTKPQGQQDQAPQRQQAPQQRPLNAGQQARAQQQQRNEESNAQPEYDDSNIPF